MKAIVYFRARQVALSRAKSSNSVGHHETADHYCERAVRLHYHYCTKRGTPDMTALVLHSMLR